MRFLRFSYQVVQAATTFQWAWGAGGPLILSGLATLFTIGIGAASVFVVLVCIGAFLIGVALVLAIIERRWRIRFRRIYRSSGSDAGSHAQVLLGHVADAARPRGEPYTQLAGLVHEFIQLKAERTKHDLGVRVESAFPRVDTRDTFIEFFAAYQHVVRWMDEMSRLLAVDVSSDTHYGLWKQADELFLSDVKADLDTTSDRKFVASIRRLNWPQGGQRDYSFAESSSA